MRLAFARNFQTHRKRLARRGAPVGFFLRQIAKRIAALIDAFGGVRARAIGDALLYSRVVALVLSA